MTHLEGIANVKKSKNDSEVVIKMKNPRYSM